ncbi:MAG: 3-phosphoglycerate dehydrogenase family protein [Oscillospiraceae bacterium]
MYTIKTLNKIAAIGTDNFDAANYTISDTAANADAVLVRSASMLDAEFNPELIAIARAGAGVNNIPVERCSEAGICVFNTPGANANAVKELAVAGLLMASRRIPDAIDWAKTLKGKGAEVGKLVEKGKGDFVGPEIAGKTLGLVGLGAIGGKIANAAIALGMKVIGFDPFLSVSSALHIDPAVKVTANKNELYANADYLSLHLPYNKETKESINADTFALMKDGVRILNFARGELVNDADMLNALESGKIARYVTDFPTDELIGAKNVIAIPHLGASTPESEDNCAYMAAIQLIDYIENGNITNSVNLPNASLPKTGDVLICVIHKNVPATISQITSAISDSGANIENLVNKSSKEWAYTMLDVTGTPDISKIESIPGIVRVRAL